MKKTTSYLLIIILCCFGFINLTPSISSAATDTSLDSSVKITSKHAVVIDMDTGEVIYSLNAEDKVQMASTTKLMTAILLSEKRQKDDLLQMSAAAKALPSSSVSRDKLPQMPVGEKITADNVMKGLLLYSGNDMAQIIAENISGSIQDFSTLMNDRAKELGMNNTHFYTPNGLDTDSILNGNNHYSTSYDMGLLGIEAFKHDWIQNTIATQKFNFSTTGNLKCELTNTNKNLNKDGCIGGKTGYTDKAGKCLVAFYKKNNKNLAGVVLGGENPSFFEDMNKIIDYSSKKSKEKYISSEETLKETSVKFKPSKYTKKEVEYSIPVFTKENIMQYNNDFNEKNTKVSIDINDSIDTDNLNTDTVIGTLKVTNNTETNTFNLYTSSTTDDFISDNQDYINKINSNVKLIKYSIIIVVSIIIILIILAYKRIQYVKRRNKRRNSRKHLRAANSHQKKKLKRR